MDSQFAVIILKMTTERKELFGDSKRRRRDLVLLLTFITMVSGFLIFWFFFHKEPPKPKPLPEVGEIIYAEEVEERDTIPEMPPARRVIRRKPMDSLTVIESNDPKLESDFAELTETQIMKSRRILSEVDVRMRQLELRKRYIRNHFQNFLFTRQNNYNQNENGGISNLYITLNNVSEFSIDLAEIQVQYIDPGVGVVKEETLFFTNIEPKGQLTLKAPDSSRGSIVTHFFSRIKSVSLNFCYSPDKWQKGADDPYKCKTSTN